MRWLTRHTCWDNSSVNSNPYNHMKSFTFFLLLIGFTAPHGSAQSKTEEPFVQIVETMEEAWNTKNGDLFASVFANDHDYVVWTGLYFANMNRESNAQAHHQILNYQYKTTDLKLKLGKMREIRNDLVLLHVFAASFEQGTPVPEHPELIITMLVEKQTDGWKIISFHNCDIEVSFDPQAEPKSPVPLTAQYAAWYKA